MNKIIQLKDKDGNNVLPVGFNQGGVKMDLLWTNPNPSSNFDAGSVEILNIDDYKFIVIVLKENASSVNGIDFIANNNRELTDRVIDYLSSSGILSRRSIQLWNSGIYFYNSTKYSSYGTSSVDNSLLIPTKIYGIKTSYIVPTEVQGLQYVEVE